MINIAKFNLFCIFVSGFFILGTAYVWRGSFAHAKNVSNVQDVEIVGYEEFASQENQNIGETQKESQEIKEEGSIEVKIKDISKGINLAVPFTSQAPEKDWEQPWQDACEEAAVLMLDAYYKGYGLSPLFAKDEILKMVAWEENTMGWGRSINIEKVQKLASWQVGKLDKGDFKIIENPTVEQIKQSISNGHPVLVVADGKVLPNPHFRNGGPEYHALIIRGYTSDKFITNDPGTQHGENFTYLYGDLMNAIRDWNNGDVKNGRRVVLVVE